MDTPTFEDNPEYQAFVDKFKPKLTAERAAAERAAAERAAAHVWELSDREREIVANLG